VDRAKAARIVQLKLALLFLTLLTVAAFFQTLAIIAGLQDRPPLTIIPEDTSPGLRLVMFLVGVGLSWVLSRQLFKMMVEGQIHVSDSTNTSYVLLFYLVLIVASIFLLSVIGWFWLPVLFLFLLIYSVLTLWKLVGALFTLAAIAAALIIMACTWFVFS
jgi:hypothetical protein